MERNSAPRRIAAQGRAIFRAAFCLGMLALLLPVPAQAQRGGLLYPRNLAQLVAESERIVVGRVVSARAEKHPEFEHLDTVVVTLEVGETWKGSRRATLTFRQYVWDIRDRENVLGYRPGESVLLLLIPPSPYGLSSPAGLTLGRFRIVRDREGRRVGVNQLSNRGLFEGIEAQLQEKGIVLSPALASLVGTHREGAIVLDVLRALIQELAGREAR